MNSPSSDTVLSRCQQCGSPLNVEAPDGFCPSCMLEGALQLGSAPERRIDLTSDATDEVRTRFADYDLLEEIARGGMGVVYRARQRSLNRIVAVKMILAGQFASKHEVLRFRAEAETAARLHHPNIVAVHETGEHEGQHYFSMDFVQGRSLAEIVRDDGPLPAKRAATYVRSIAEAIHYAHEQGVLHRDLKPSNVLIDAEDRLRITDFGLAKRLRGDFGLTVTGQVLGSPNFMPPEQAAGSGGVERETELKVESGSDRGAVTALNSQHKPLSTSSKVGPASDVYGLGAILYHLLTGRPPFQAETIQDVLVQLRESEVIPPRKLNASVPRDLETICLKCLEKEPTRRYQTAEELEAELSRFLNHQPIKARPVSHVESAWRWCRRKPVVAGLSLATGLLLLVLLIGSPIAAFRIATGRKELRRSLYAANMQQLQQSWQNGQAALAVNLLEAQRPKSGQEDLRGFEWRYFWKVFQGDQVSTLRGHLNRVSFVAFGSQTNTILSASQEGKVRIWIGEKFSEFGVPYNANVFPVPVGLSPDGQTLAWGARGVSLWRTQPMSEVTNLWTDNYVVSVLAFSRDNQKLAAAGSVQASNQIRICDLATKQLTAVLTDLPYYWGLHGPTIVSLVFSPQGETLAAGGRLGLFKVWNTSTWQEISPDSKPELDKLLEIRSLSFSPDGHLLAIPQGKAVKLLDFRTGSTSSLSLAEDAEEALQVAFSPDGESLAVGTLSGVIKLFKTKTNRKIRSLVGHTEAISSLAFSQDGGSIVSGSSDKSVRVWNVSENSREEVIRGYTNSVLCLALSNNGQLLASGSSDGAIKLWDAASLRELITLGGHKYRIRSLSFSPDSSRLVSTSGDETEEGSPSEPGEVKLWDVTKRTELGTLQGLTNAVRSAAFSSDGSTLAVATSYVAELWDASTRRFPSSLPEQEKNFGERLTAIAFSPDGQTLAVGSYSDSIELWDVPSRRPMVALSGLGGGVECMAFSPDGKLLATGSRDLLVRLWDVRARKLLAAMPGHKALSITSVAFSPDGKTLSSGGADGTVRLWCVAARSEVATLRSDSDKVFSVVFSPDGECLLSANGRGTFGFWRAPSFRETDSALKTKSQ